MSVGPWQIILILVIVLIIFGAGKLPRVMGDIAKGVKNFKTGLRDDGGDSTSDSTTDSAAAAARSLEDGEDAKSTGSKDSHEGKSAARE